MIEAAIFDMDGLMFDTESLWAEAWTRVLAVQGHEATRDFIVASLGSNEKDQTQLLYTYYGRDLPIQQLFDEAVAFVQGSVAEHVPKKQGLDELLSWLAERDVPCAVVSGSDASFVEDCLVRSGVRNYFSHVSSTADLEHGKPAPDGFLRAAKLLGVNPERSMVLEDAPAGVEAGHAGGFITVMVPDVAEPTPRTKSLCAAVCSNLNEVRSLLERGVIG